MTRNSLSMFTKLGNFNSIFILLNQTNTTSPSVKVQNSDTYTSPGMMFANFSIIARRIIADQ